MDCRPSQSRKKTGGAMSKTSVHRIFLGVLVLMPAALFAQQAAQPKTKAARGKTEEPQPKKEEAKKEEARNDEAMKLTQEPQQKTEEDGKLTPVPGSKALGMSILGNQEAPKALVIVPWKSSELGNGPGVSTLLDDSRRPVDKEVFMLIFSYYPIRPETPPPSGASTNARTA